MLSDSSELMLRTKPKLPFLTPQQTTEVESLIRKAQLSPNECPTCHNRPQDRDGDGVLDWYKSYYRFKEADHLCDCDTQMMLLRHYMLARIPTKYIRYSEEDWFGDDDAIVEVFKYLNEWPEHRQDGTGLGFYCEGLGRGKTFLATFIARALIRLGESVTFTHFSKVLPLYQMPYENRRVEEDRLKESGVLILDEVTKPTSGPMEDLIAREFENLIRYRSDYNKPTIFTTNLEPEDLEKKFPRVYSLLADSSIEIRLGQEMDEDFRRKLRDRKRERKKKGEVKPIC